MPPQPRIRGLALLAAVGASAAAVALFALLSPQPGSPSAADAHAPAECVPGGDCVIEIGGLWFCDSGHQNDQPNPAPPGNRCDVTVQAGDTVTWRQLDIIRPHTVTECGDDLNVSVCPATRQFDSENMPKKSPGGVAQTFSVSFTAGDAGKTFLYRCEVHPAWMWGSVTVLAAPDPGDGGGGDGGSGDGGSGNGDGDADGGGNGDSGGGDTDGGDTDGGDGGGTGDVGGGGDGDTGSGDGGGTGGDGGGTGVARSLAGPDELPNGGSAPEPGGGLRLWTIIGVALAVTMLAGGLVTQGLRSR